MPAAAMVHTHRRHIKIKTQSNPCLTCGACCAHYRVSFYWEEASPQYGSVPEHLTEDVTEFIRCMKGTNQKLPRCIALTGEVGKTTHCTIYASRPSPCHEFGVHYLNHHIVAEKGALERCNRARAAHNLPPINEDKPKIHPPHWFSLNEGAHYPPQRHRSSAASHSHQAHKGRRYHTFGV